MHTECLKSAHPEQNTPEKKKPKVYIDGQSGTTGLQIAARLAKRDDLDVLKISDELRHDDAARKQMMEQADLVFFCLPDAAAIEAAKLCPKTTKIIDASTAHRTVDGWTYGFAELNGQAKEAIRKSSRTANPGCHASGAIALLSPLVQSGLLDPNAFLSIYSLTGYTGGGKKMIAGYEEDPQENLKSPGAYARGLQHKHLPEIVKYSQLEKTPGFLPVVDDFAQGMLVSVMLDQSMLKDKVTADQIRDVYRSWYKDSKLIEVGENPGTIYANALAGSDGMRIYVSGNEEQILLQAQFDNLGKGASGAAVQNMNLMLGLDEYAGLHLPESEA